MNIVSGVPHAEELYYEFGSPFFANTPCPGPREATCPVTWQNYQPWSQTDGQVSRSTMAIWTAFAKQGLVQYISIIAITMMDTLM